MTPDPDRHPMGGGPGSQRGAVLAACLTEAPAELIHLIQPIALDRWRHVPAPGLWSIGKDAEHVAEATVYHHWIVRLTIHQKVPSRRPGIERQEMTTELTPDEVVALLLRRTAEGVALIRSLSDAELDLPTRPRRARAPALADTIDRVLIGHYHTHRREIETKLGRRS